VTLKVDSIHKSLKPHNEVSQEEVSSIHIRMWGHLHRTGIVWPKVYLYDVLHSGLQPLNYGTCVTPIRRNR
jgi:hypothetical protein